MIGSWTAPFCLSFKQQPLVWQKKKFISLWKFFPSPILPVGQNCTQILYPTTGFNDQFFLKDQRPQLSFHSPAHYLNFKNLDLVDLFLWAIRLQKWINSVPLNNSVLKYRTCTPLERLNTSGSNSPSQPGKCHISNHWKLKTVKCLRVAREQILKLWLSRRLI